MKSNYGTLFLSPLESFFPFHSLFFSNLLIVKLSEIIYNDRNGQRNDQNTTNSARRPDYFPYARRRADVPVADGTHGDDGPPEGLGDAAEECAFFILLSKITQTWEYEDAHGQEQHEKSQLFIRVFQSEAQTLKTSGVSCKLKYSQYSHDSKDLHYSSHIFKLVGVLIGFYQKQGDEVGQDGQHVDNVHPSFHKLPLGGAGGESEYVLQGEPGDADGFNHCQLGIVDLSSIFIVAWNTGDGIESQGHCW